MDRQVGVQGLRGLRPPAGPSTAPSVLALIERHGVDACLLRDAGPGEAPIEEIDLLVAPQAVESLERLLEEHGFVRRPAWGRRPHRFTVGYSPERDRWLKVDTVTALVYGTRLEFVLAPAGPFLDRARVVSGRRRLEPADELGTLLLHCLLDKRAVRADHAARLAELAPEAESGGPGVELASHALSGSIGWERAVALVRSGRWSELEAAAEPTARSLARSGPARVAARRVANGGLRRLSKLQTLVSRRGLRVVLLGPDGAGKSTTAAELVRTFPFGARRLYAGLYPAGSTGPSVPGLGLLGRLIRLRYASAVARVHQWRGRLVIFDRYTIDARLAASDEDSARTRVRRWLLAHACAAPDLIVVLDAPAELLYARKGEHSVEGLERQRRRFLALAERMPHALVVDAGQEPEHVRRVVTAAVWNGYRDRERGARAAPGRAASLTDA